MNGKRSASLFGLVIILTLGMHSATAAPLTIGNMPADGVPVYKRTIAWGTDSNWNIESLKKDDNNYWSITCKQDWKRWGRIVVQVDFQDATHPPQVLKEIAFDTKLEGWAEPMNFEVKVYYKNRTPSGWISVSELADSIQDIQLKNDPVTHIVISEGQFGWFRLHVDSIYGIRK